MPRVLVCMQLASAYGKLGNIDANTGDAQTGWDTDQFLTDPKEALLVAATILKQGGLAPGKAHLGSAEWVTHIDRSSTFQQTVQETPSVCPLVKPCLLAMRIWEDAACCSASSGQTGEECTSWSSTCGAYEAYDRVYILDTASVFLSGG